MKPTLLVALLLASSLAFADSPAPPATHICQPAQLISAEKFDRPESFTNPKAPGTDGWRGVIGTWSIKDGAN